MKLNSNAVHNLLNVLIALIAAITAFMIATGCTVLPQATALLASDTAVIAECSKSWLSPEVTAMIVTGLASVKSIMNVVRDGFAGLFKKQPPVK